MKQKYYIGCRSSGCQFLKLVHTRKQANLEATSHLKMYGHDVSIVHNRKDHKV